ncbi:MAG: hypothetical protein HY074_17950 [Deltaproteobacteria bacterium]|nr:hypothetical protein [Deltaproteobacteria bacterium]
MKAVIIRSLWFAALALGASGPHLIEPAFAIFPTEKNQFTRLSREILNAAGCETCMSNPPTAADCAAAKGKLDKLYCDSENTIVNPFMVLTGFSKARDAGTVSLRCRVYLLEKAYRSTPSLIAGGHLTEEEKAIVQFGGGLHFLARNGALDWGAGAGDEASGGDVKSCSPNKALSGLAHEVATILAPELKAAHDLSSLSNNGDSRLTNQYCAAVYSACKLVGGHSEAVGGKQVCRSGGLVIDSSCLSLGVAQRKRLAGALVKVRGQGVGCLRDNFRDPQFGMGAAQAGQALSEHLNSTGAVNTQVCCGSNGCTSNLKSVFGPYTQPPANKYADMVAFAYDSGAKGKGIIEISDNALSPLEAKPNDEFSSALFHEFLHRVGLCKSPFHNFPSGSVAAANGNCPALGGDRFKADNGVCVPTNACYAASREQSIYRYDAVYACQAACFPGTAYNPNTHELLKDGELAEARQTCGRYAGHGNFTGADTISDLPAGKSGSANQQSNLCTFWSGKK